MAMLAAAKVKVDKANAQVERRRGGARRRTRKKKRMLRQHHPCWPPIEWLQDEILCIAFSNLDIKTAMVSVPQVCKLWRALCKDIQDVHLAFSWCGKKDEDGDLEGKDVRSNCLPGGGRSHSWQAAEMVAALTAVLKRRAVGRLACASCYHERRP